MRMEDERLCEEAEQVASRTECTGLVPALRDGEDDARAMYAVQKAKRTHKNEKRG